MKKIYAIITILIVITATVVAINIKNHQNRPMTNVSTNNVSLVVTITPPPDGATFTTPTHSRSGEDFGGSSITKVEFTNAESPEYPTVIYSPTSNATEETRIESKIYPCDSGEGGCGQNYVINLSD